MMQRKVGILLFDDVEVLDFAGPFEVFSLARLNEERRQNDPSPFDLVLIAEKDGPVRASGGLKVIPDNTFNDCPPLDILVVPGGWGTRKEISNERLIAWIQGQAREVERLCAVCTGSMLIGRAGLLNGRRVTTHFQALEWMRSELPSAIVEDTLRVVEDGIILTSAGISAGIDMALTVVLRYFGEPVARATARRMEYPFPETNQRIPWESRGR
jgi:transcriptional regulator GlxA family with amidase domain